MSESLELVGKLRTEFGKGAARELRRIGMIPVVIYGQNANLITASVEEKEITKRYRKPCFISTVINLKIESTLYKVLPKDVQLHPITDIVRHVDFIHLQQKKQKIEIPIVYEGKERAIGIKRGGFFNIIKRTIVLLCNTDNIPQKIVVDVTNMHIGHTLRLSNINLPEGSEPINNSDFVLATIIGRKGTKSDDEGASTTTQTPDTTKK